MYQQPLSHSPLWSPRPNHIHKLGRPKSPPSSSPKVLEFSKAMLLKRRVKESLDFPRDDTVGVAADPSTNLALSEMGEGGG